MVLDMESGKRGISLKKDKRIGDTFNAPYELFVDLTMPLKTEDASGETSSTARAGKGSKGKKLEVRLCMKYEQAEQLTELTRKAEAKENGDAKKYTITNDTANIAGLKQATFTGDFKVSQNETLRKWDISFSLIEYISVPELAEQRTEKKDGQTQKNQGEVVGLNDFSSETTAKMSWIEKQLQKLNDYIGPESE